MLLKSHVNQLFSRSKPTLSYRNLFCKHDRDGTKKGTGEVIGPNALHCLAGSQLISARATGDHICPLLRYPSPRSQRDTAACVPGELPCNMLELTLDLEHKV